MTTRWLRVALAPVALVAAGACATRTDVRVLQNDLANLKAERNAADSANRAQLERVIATLGAVSDSMVALTGRSSRFQATVQQDMYAMQQQLVTIQELTGQSQRRLQELRASMEQRAQALATQAAPAPTAAPPAATPPAGAASTAGTPAGTMTGPTGSTPGGPGPNQLFQLALDQLRRGSTGSARAAFQDLLRQYPQSDVAGDAQFYIAESYAAEGKAAQADSVYAIVVASHATSTRAATALYKRGVAAETAGRPADARAFYEGVVSQYPRSDEAALARDRLAALK